MLSQATTAPKLPSSAKIVDRSTTVRDSVASARGVQKTFALGGEKRWILRGVDFNVWPGECVILSGPSGSGKSTLLSILGCLLTPDGGEVTLGGQAIGGLSSAQLASVRRDLIGFVFQRFQLIRGLSAEENVAIPLALKGMATIEARRQASEWLARVGLEDHRHALPTRMSPGQCQRVALARALITRPKLVLADEPTAALDSRTGADAMNLLRALVKDTGAAAVVVTHDPRILVYADRQCHIEHGMLQ